MRRTRTELGPKGWRLKQNADGYWMWERGYPDGPDQESPILCVRELARKWMRSWKSQHVTLPEEKK